MRIEFSRRAWEQFWKIAKDNPKLLKRFRALVDDIVRDPFQGIGKPEPLKHEYAGYWSRRLNLEDRVVYRVYGTGDEQRLFIVQCSEHY